MTPVAVVMNMFYTGLGIARSLGENGIRVIGLSSQKGIYGNFTRYAEVRRAPDSREQPDALLDYLVSLGDELSDGGILFPTRDDDVLFLDRYRDQLSRNFILAVPPHCALAACLNKAETYRSAQSAGVPCPRSWSIGGPQELVCVAQQVAFPCVLKPVSAHHWRKGANWQMVGGRKAIPVFSPDELFAEYENIARAECRALVQEMVPGGDDCLWIAACYLDRNAKFVAGFTAQKLWQVPQGFGTGCVVESADCPELLVRAARLLESMGFSGIAEVEFKRDPSSGEYQLIEINPRPWDQHRLGNACGVDLIHTAYCDAAGLDLPKMQKQSAGQKWIAEDVFCWELLRSVWRGDRKFLSLLRLARGRRTYAIWSILDPLPMLGFLTVRLIPELIGAAIRRLRSLLARSAREKMAHTRSLSYKNLEEAKCDKVPNGS